VLNPLPVPTMLTQTADHALRALLAIARHGGERPLRVEEVAGLTGAPRNYLGKTLGGLVKAGLLQSARGPLGGFSLAVAPGDVTVGRIADLFAEPRAARRCLLGDGICNPTRPCTAHHRWTAVKDAARAPLDRTTLADLLSGSDANPTQHMPAAGLAAVFAGAAGQS
jgi:Rrf2 family protein